MIDPNEGRNAAIALEMPHSSHWLVPSLNALPYLDKPFLFFATEAISIRGSSPSKRYEEDSPEASTADVEWLRVLLWPG